MKSDLLIVSILAQHGIWKQFQFKTNILKNNSPYIYFRSSSSGESEGNIVILTSQISKNILSDMAILPHISHFCMKYYSSC